jgi:hypothetical protein
VTAKEGLWGLEEVGKMFAPVCVSMRQFIRQVKFKPIRTEASYYSIKAIALGLQVKT